MKGTHLYHTAISDKLITLQSGCVSAKINQSKTHKSINKINQYINKSHLQLIDQTKNQKPIPTQYPKHPNQTIPKVTLFPPSETRRHWLIQRPHSVLSLLHILDHHRHLHNFQQNLGAKKGRKVHVVEHSLWHLVEKLKQLGAHKLILNLVEVLTQIDLTRLEIRDGLGPSVGKQC